MVNVANAPISGMLYLQYLGIDGEFTCPNETSLVPSPLHISLSQVYTYLVSCGSVLHFKLG